MDPTKRLEVLPGRPVRLRFWELRRWFRLLDKFIANDSTLKLMIVDVEEIDNIRTVMAVGKKGKWTIRAQYMEALEKVMIGGFLKNMSFSYAS